MDISTIIGLVVAVGFVIFGMSGNVGAFIEINSMAIVIGGTIGVMFVRYPIKMITGIVPVMMKTLFVKLESPDEMIKKIISLSVEAKKNGILGLEKVKIDNPFLKKGVQLAIDGVEPELIEAVLKIDISAMSQRHDNGNNLMVAAGDAAPAFGMVGTL
ncbi:MAG: motility protein A, partial [bacterium]|nr:motility protein A [bacterium]